MLFPDHIEYRIAGGDVLFPRMFKVRQVFSRDRIDDVPEAVRREMERLALADVAGKRVALTAGSRGVANQALILKTAAAFLGERGAIPFAVPAMGSHAGATAEGQREFLAGYGITEERIGVPILSDMGVVKLGETASGFPVYCDRYAAEADFILPIH